MVRVGKIAKGLKKGIVGMRVWHGMFLVRS